MRPSVACWASPGPHVAKGPEAAATDSRSRGLVGAVPGVVVRSDVGVCCFPEEVRESHLDSSSATADPCGSAAFLGTLSAVS